MKFTNFANITCRFCNEYMTSNQLSSRSLSHYNCICDNLSYDIFSEEKHSFYMFFPQKYQIQIHSTINNKLIVFYLKKTPYNVEHSNILSLDYIPDLDWESPDLLNKLLSLTTFS